MDRRRLAHDLRQPLAAAEMHAHLLGSRLVTLRVADDDPAHEHLKILSEQLRALALGLDSWVDGPAPAAEPAAPASALNGALVALVEDDEAVRAGLEAVLQQAGAFVQAGANLAALLERLEQADRMPDLILTDWHLGAGGDGGAVIEALRRRCAPRVLPALVLTAYERDAAPALAGIARVELLRKPVTSAELLARLAAQLEST